MILGIVDIVGSLVTAVLVGLKEILEKPRLVAIVGIPESVDIVEPVVLVV